MTFIFSTHDPRVVAHAARVVTLVDGRVAGDEVTPGEAPHEIVPGVPDAPDLFAGRTAGESMLACGSSRRFARAAARRSTSHSSSGCITRPRRW